MARLQKSSKSAKRSRLSHGVIRARKNLATLKREPVPKRQLPKLLRLATTAVNARSERARWQAFFAIQSAFPEHSEYFWPAIVEWGSARSKPLRTIVACALLEHLLEFDFRTYFGKSKAVIEQGNCRFAYTLAYCMKLGDAAKARNAQRFDKFIERLATTNKEVAVLQLERARPVSPAKAQQQRKAMEQSIVYLNRLWELAKEMGRVADTCKC